MATEAIVKVGGSLLHQQSLGPRLMDWLQRQSFGNAALVIGGGAEVEHIRRNRTDEHIDHWRAIEAMERNARRFSDWYGFSTVSDGDAAAEIQIPAVVIELPSILRDARNMARLGELPACWDVTSDAIAAWIALAWSVPRVVLLKSCRVPEVAADSLAERGIVDAVFPKLVERLKWSVTQLV